MSCTVLHKLPCIGLQAIFGYHEGLTDGSAMNTWEWKFLLSFCYQFLPSYLLYPLPASFSTSQNKLLLYFRVCKVPVKSAFGFSIKTVQIYILFCFWCIQYHMRGAKTSPHQSCQPNLNHFTNVKFGLPGENNNESWHKTDCYNLMSNIW